MPKTTTIFGSVHEKANVSEHVIQEISLAGYMRLSRQPKFIWLTGRSFWSLVVFFLPAPPFFFTVKEAVKKKTHIAFHKETRMAFSTSHGRHKGSSHLYYRLVIFKPMHSVTAPPTRLHSIAHVH